MYPPTGILSIVVFPSSFSDIALHCDRKYSKYPANKSPTCELNRSSCPQPCCKCIIDSLLDKADSYSSVLPPPPTRYTAPVAYAAGASNGMIVPIVETANIISNPEGGCPLQVGEGMYRLQEGEGLSIAKRIYLYNRDIYSQR